MLSRIKRLLGFSTPSFEVSKQEIVKHLNTKSPIIIEAGASSGEDTVELARLFPKGTIYAFEPLPHIFPVLEAKVQRFKNVNIFELALSSTTGKSIINISSNNSSSSLMEPKEHLIAHPEIVFEKQVIVNTISLDDFTQKQRIDKVDFMWLDMQGMEYDVLKASKNTFQKVDLLYTEVSLIETYKNVPLYADFKNWLALQGFSVVWEGLYWADMGNVLFKKNK
jgi:2-O-methyltransferase